jgi:hypothetical protein
MNRSRAAGVPIDGFHGGTFLTRTAEHVACHGRGGAGHGRARQAGQGTCSTPATTSPATIAKLDRVELDHNVRAIAWVIGCFILDRS